MEPVLLDAGARVSPVLKEYVEGYGETTEISMATMVPGIPGVLNLRYPDACQALIDSAGRAQTQQAPQTQQASVSAKADRYPPADKQQRQARTVALAANHQIAAGPVRRQPSSTRPRPSDVTEPGAVSEVHGGGSTLVIPALEVHAPIVTTGAVGGSMTIPADIHTVGWYNGVDSTDGTTTSAPTPWPGQPGVSLLAGHVDWAGEGPGALYYIGQLVTGDPIEVIGSNRETTDWRVSQPPIIVAKAALPADLLVNSGPPKLALVTCGGPFDAATGHYMDDVIVCATLTTR